jgi:Trp operon repressor
MVEMGVAKMFDQSHAPDELLATVIAAIDEKDAMTSRFEVVEQVGDLQAAARMLQTISSSITAKIAP